ncbi:MAG TPA: hypothetical protein VG167_18825 [Verrucomicrobiae bacterium]|nr:hypothetical protein [Verrucomicrobiae bacterium]
MKNLIGLVIGLAMFGLTVTWKPQFSVGTPSAWAAGSCITGAQVTFFSHNCASSVGFGTNSFGYPTSTNNNGGGVTFTFNGAGFLGYADYGCTNSYTWGFAWSAGANSGCCSSTLVPIANLELFYFNGTSSQSEVYLPACASGLTWKWCLYSNTPCYTASSVFLALGPPCAGCGGQQNPTLTPGGWTLMNGASEADLPADNWTFFYLPGRN